MNKYIQVAVICLLSACGSISSSVQPPKVDQQSAVDTLIDLGTPKSKPLIVGVPNFQDQTGQRAWSDRNVAEMSTAIPQGLSTILVQELHRAGNGKFYRVVEREFTSSLLDERRLAAITLEKTGSDTVRPLLLPGILLVGGAVSYDRKVTQSMSGVGLDSINVKRDVVSDEVGVILRAVSVQTGEILHSVHARKSVLSQLDSLNGLKILDNKVAALELADVENEPVSLAVRLAIASAVSQMTEYGIENGWWKMEPKPSI